MTNENKDKIIDRVIDFLHNKPLKSDMRIAAALIEELKLAKNCYISDFSNHVYCPHCGNERELIVETDLNSDRTCMNKLCRGK